MQSFGPLENDNPLALIRNIEVELRNVKARLAQLDVGGHPNLSSGVPAGVLQPLQGGTGHALLGSPLGVTVWLSPGAGTRGTVVVTTTTDRTYGTSTTQGDTNVIGVLDDAPSGAGENVRVRHIGYQPVVRCAGAVTAGHFLRQSTSAGLAEDAGTSIVAGAFGIAMTTIGGAGNVAAWIFPPEYAASGSGYDTVEDEGVGLTQRSTINFTGAGVTASDSGGKTVVNIPSGGGAPTDYPYAGFGTHASLSAEVDLQGNDFHLANEIMNFPSLEGANDTQPEWWEEADGNATLTEVDIAGEAGITETWERAHKVVVATANSYSYQRYTYADQPRIKSGRLLSALFAVWSVSNVNARIRLITSASTAVVSSTTTTAGWTILKAENLTLDGTYVDIRCEVDIGTAYFVPLGIMIGPKAIALAPRTLRPRYIDATAVKTLTGIGDEATWTDIDCTASSSALAAIGFLRAVLVETAGGNRFALYTRRNGSSGSGTPFVVAEVEDTNAERNYNDFQIVFDDAQVFEYFLDRLAGAGTLAFGEISLIGWLEWA